VTRNDLKDLDRRLAEMSARCDRVIARERPLEPDRSRGKVRLDDGAGRETVRPALVATGELEGHEMPMPERRADEIAKPRRAPRQSARSGYSPGIVQSRNEHGPGCPCGCEGVHDIESAFEAFERECRSEYLG